MMKAFIYKARMLFVFIAHYFIILFQSFRQAISTITQPNNVIIVLMAYALYDLFFKKSGYWFMFFLAIIIIHMFKAYSTGDHIAWDRKRLYKKIIKGEDAEKKDSNRL